MSRNLTHVRRLAIRRLASSILTGLATAVFAACAGEPPVNNGADAGTTAKPWTAQLDRQANEAGKFNVGFRTYKHTYKPKLSGAPERELTINIWYPTQAKTGEMPTYFNAWQADFFFVDPAEIVVLNAKPAAPLSAKGYPVLAISHGANGFGASTARINHYFARHGWVVVAPDHLTDTLSDIGKKSALWLRLVRPLDVSAAIDSLATLPADTLAGPLYTEALAFGGHSRGGVTTWAASGAMFDRAAIKAKCTKDKDPLCTDELLDAYAVGAHDPRVACGIPMAGAGGFDPWFGETGHSKAKVAQLQLSGSLDKDAPQTVFDKSGHVPVTWIDIEGACHQAFALGKCPKLTDAEGAAVIHPFTLAFARYHILGDRSTATIGILDGTKPVSSKATVKLKKTDYGL